MYGGAMMNYGGNTVKVKFWEGTDCHGKATVFTLGPNQSVGCTPVANKDGQFYLVNGANSVSAYFP
jgi:hypothetical protein